MNQTSSVYDGPQSVSGVLTADTGGGCCWGPPGILKDRVVRHDDPRIGPVRRWSRPIYSGGPLDASYSAHPLNARVAALQPFGYLSELAHRPPI